MPQSTKDSRGLREWYTQVPLDGTRGVTSNRRAVKLDSGRRSSRHEENVEQKNHQELREHLESFEPRTSNPEGTIELGPQVLLISSLI